MSVKEDMDEIRRLWVVGRADKRKEFKPLDDGFQYYWPNHQAAMSASELRIIADELDRLNQPMEEQIARDVP